MGSWQSYLTGDMKLFIIFRNNFLSLDVYYGELTYQSIVQTKAYPLDKFFSKYRKISNISRTKSQNLNDSRLILHLFVSNILTPGVK